MKQNTATGAPALGDALVDYNFVATEVFRPSGARKVGVSRNGLAQMIERGAFPKPITLGDGPKARMFWRLSELQSWITSRKAA
jgi:predicted DNA-binding transcriptional regulator AlpA